jgi:hypothetical protein
LEIEAVGTLLGQGWGVQGSVAAFRERRRLVLQEEGRRRRRVRG